MNGARLIVRPSQPADLPEIASLLDRTFGPHTYEDRLRLWRWRSDENPAKSGAIPPFLVGERAGKLVGVQGIVPLRVKVRDDVIVASCSCDLAVDPEARSAGMKIKLEMMSKSISPLYVSTSANQQANKITLALGGREVPTAKYRFCKPLSVSGLLRGFLGAGRGIVIRVLALVIGVILGTPFDVALAAERNFRPSAKVGGAAIEEIIRFDDRFDRFWQVMSREAEVMQVRDSAYLNWRFAQYPFPGIQSFALVSNGEILGLGVTQHCIDAAGIRTANILELMVPSGKDEVFLQLLSECVARTRKAGALMITSRPSLANWEPLYRKHGFFRRSRGYSPVTYKNNSAIDGEVFARSANWFLSMGDGDACYFIP